MRDPHDAGYTRGILMNMSEDEQFDRTFPEHPLYVERNLRATFDALN